MLTYFAAAGCILRATVKTTGQDPGIIRGTVRQTQLQLMCDSVTCPETNFTTCDTYRDLGIPQGMTAMVLAIRV